MCVCSLQLMAMYSCHLFVADLQAWIFVEQQVQQVITVDTVCKIELSLVCAGQLPRSSKEQDLDAGHADLLLRTLAFLGHDCAAFRGCVCSPSGRLTGFAKYLSSHKES